jgi:hypothetical protein
MLLCLRDSYDFDCCDRDDDRIQNETLVQGETLLSELNKAQYILTAKALALKWRRRQWAIEEDGQEDSDEKRWSMGVVELN